MPPLRYTTQAREDLKQIRRYISQQSGSRDVAIRFIERLQAQCRALAKLPGVMGAARPALADDIRAFPFGNYIIYFRYANKTFEVVTIVERHRDMGVLFRPK